MIFLVLSLSPTASTFVSSKCREIIYPSHLYIRYTNIPWERNSKFCVVLFFVGGGEKSEPDDVEFD
jgi:hypothetical protein